MQALRSPARNCGELTTFKENIFCVRSLTPPQAAGSALAVQFNYKPAVFNFQVTETVLECGDSQ
jgi:hypothetical protein